MTLVDRMHALILCIRPDFLFFSAIDFSNPMGKTKRVHTPNIALDASLQDFQDIDRTSHLQLGRRPTSTVRNIHVAL